MRKKIIEKTSRKPDAKTRNDILEENIIFLAFNAFIMLHTIISLSIVPAWISICDFITAFFCLILFIIEFWLRVNNIHNYQSAYLLSFYLIITGLSMFWSSNISYIDQNHYGNIHEGVNYLRLSIIICLSVVIAYTLLFAIISSSKTLSKKIRNMKMQMLSLVSGVLLIVLTILILDIVRNHIFINAKGVSDFYYFLIGSAMCLGMGPSLIIYLKRLEHLNK